MKRYIVLGDAEQINVWRAIFAVPDSVIAATVSPYHTLASATAVLRGLSGQFEVVTLQSWREAGVALKAQVADDLKIIAMAQPPERMIGVVPSQVRGDGPCQDCGGDNIIWFTDNVFWNEIMRVPGTDAHDDPGGLLCIPCFVTRVFRAGYMPNGWRLLPEWEPTRWDRN